MEDIPSRLTLDSYRRLVRDLPVPSGAHVEAFCDYVANAHSWYKHIPILPPGNLFVFFLDPAAGRDRLLASDGSWSTNIRAERGFHHAAIPTQSYLEQYGHLAFASDNATRAGALGPDSVRLETGLGATVISADERLWRIPAEVEEGAVALSGLMHPFANQPFIWDMLANHKFSDGTWPEESGGDAAFARIQARCRDIEKVSPVDIWDETVRRGITDRGIDAVFAELVEPERQRQRRLMLMAIERLLVLLGLRPVH